MNNKVKYCILFYVGFTTYIAIEVMFRGYSTILMGITGAICFLFFDKINEWIPWNLDLFFQGFIGGVFVTLMELIIGLGLQWFNLPPMWDYSNEWMNYKGVICPLFSLIWIFFAMIGIILADCINYYLLWNGDKPEYLFYRKIHIVFPEMKCHCNLCEQNICSIF